MSVPCVNGVKVTVEQYTAVGSHMTLNDLESHFGCCRSPSSKSRTKPTTVVREKVLQIVQSICRSKKVKKTCKS